VIPRAEPVTVSVCQIRRPLGRLGWNTQKSGACSFLYQPVTFARRRFGRDFEAAVLEGIARYFKRDVRGAGGAFRVGEQRGD